MKTLFTALSNIIFLLAILSCESTNTPPPSAEAQEENITEQEPQEEEEEEEIWTYEYQVDEMTGDTIKFAGSVSTNQLDFEFPYNGGSDMILIIREVEGQTEVAFKIKPGQFVGSYSGEKLRIKFDDDDVSFYEYVDAANGVSDIIFLAKSKRFIKRLLATKKLMVEAPFFDAGRQIAHFDTEGLEWEL